LLTFFCHAFAIAHCSHVSKLPEDLNPYILIVFVEYFLATMSKQLMHMINIVNSFIAD
jgi:hypothetical protein